MRPKDAVSCSFDCFTSGRHRLSVLMSAYSHKRTFRFTRSAVPAAPRNDRVQHNPDFAKDVQWHGLSRPRRPPSRPGEVLGVGMHTRAFYRTCSRIELPRPDFWARSVGGSFSLSDFLRRFRFCPLAGLSFGHVFFAFPLPRKDRPTLRPRL